MTYKTDDQAKPPRPLIAEHPYTICVENLNDSGHHRFENRPVVRSRKRRKEVVDVTIPRGEPVEEVSAAEHRLYNFEEKYAVHYSRTIRKLRGGIGAKIAYRAASRAFCL